MTGILIHQQDTVMVSQHLLDNAVQRLVEEFHPQKIILFGSQARGTADEHSDVDLLVVAPVTGKRRDMVVSIDRVLRGIGFARDIIVVTPEEYDQDRHIPGTLSRPASQEGKILYDHSCPTIRHPLSVYGEGAGG